MDDEYCMNIVFSLILGCVFGYILYWIILNKPIVKGPNSRDIVNKTYKYNGKYYIFEPIVCMSIYSS